MVAAVITACGNSDKVSQKRTVIDTLIPVDTTAGLVASNPVTIKLSVDGARPISKQYVPVQVISFDEDTENIIGVPVSIVVMGDTIFMIDPNQSIGFYAYRHDGSQIFSYCSIGNGPEDLMSARCLNVTDSLLSAYDDRLENLIFIDKNGQFVKRYPISTYSTGAIQDSSGGIWTDYSNQEFETTKLSWKPTPDAIETEVLSVPEYLKGITSVGLQGFTSIDDGTINYVPTLEPRIYGLSKGKAWIKYELDFDGLWPDEDTIGHELGGNDWAIKISSFPVQRLTVVENDRWLVFSFQHNHGNYIHVHDKNASRGDTYIDEEDKYFSPKALNGNRLYIPTKEDTLAIIDLSKHE